MSNIKYFLEQLKITKQLAWWFLILLPVAVTIGLLVAFFLWLLDIVTTTREQHQWLIYLLPIAGVFISWIYTYFGKNVNAGNNLIIEEIHQPDKGVPARMTPLVLGTTILTHLFGGSAGREGTAVQMGGSIAAAFAKLLTLNVDNKRILLMCGIAAGFSAVFGTPVAGTIFALEVLTIGKIKYDALFPCLIASVIAHITCISCGIQHIHYSIDFVSSNTNLFSYFSIDIFLLIKVAIAGVLFGFASFLFRETAHFIKSKTNKLFTKKWMIPIIGGVLVVGISFLLGTTDYLGLGVTSPNKDGISIVSAFHADGTNYFSWFWKLLLTAITLSTGFKGGEVTPLFFIGATLGNTLAILSGSPIDLFAGLGFIAVFAGATNTPIACILMGVELFGGEHVLYYAVACFMAYYFSGHTGIYHAQRKEQPKF
jgi:H+/Cl- antiporter ClcA